jgi:3-oxoacyl-[acyl-carrier-protein] synthase II
MANEDPNRMGCLVGSGIGGMTVLEDQHNVLITRGPDRCSPFMIPMMIVNMASGLIAIDHGLKGPNFCVVSACASGAHSVGEGLRLIQRGECDMVLAGGTEAAITPLGITGFCSMKAMSTRNDAPEKASRPFDANRDGFVMGEGAGLLVLEDYEHAVKRGAKIYCELAGYGATCDASHITAPAPGGEGAARAMAKAMADGGVSPDGVDYVNAHGTSTPLNDKNETAAIKTALGEHSKKVMVSSTKSMTGHMLGAAGGIESVICALALKRGVVPPTMNYETPDPECDLDYVPNQAREVKVRACLNNSLGFGGHNASLLFKAI